MKLSRRMLFSSLSLITSSLLFVSIGGPAADAITNTPNPDPSQQITSAYQSPSGTQVTSKLAALVSDPALRQSAQDLLNSYGPSGSKALSLFEVQLMNALIIATKYPDLLSARLTGKRLSGRQVAEELLLRAQLSENPAVRALTSAGNQLRHSSALATDISAGATGAQTSYSTLTPPPTAGQGGSAALDKIIGDFASLRTSPDFGTYATQLAPVLSNPKFEQLAKSQSALTLAAFLPTGDLEALQVPSGHGADIIYTTAIINDIGTALWDIVGPIAVFAVGLYFLPVEVPAALVFATLLGAIYAGQQVADGIVTIANDLDCDHDGDPFDSADAPGQEC